MSLPVYVTLGLLLMTALFCYAMRKLKIRYKDDPKNLRLIDHLIERFLFMPGIGLTILLIAGFAIIWWKEGGMSLREFSLFIPFILACPALWGLYYWLQKSDNSDKTR